MLVRSKDIGYYTHLFLLMALLIKCAVIWAGDKNIPRKSFFSFSLIQIKVPSFFFRNWIWKGEEKITFSNVKVVLFGRQIRGIVFGTPSRLQITIYFLCTVHPYPWLWARHSQDSAELMNISSFKMKGTCI